MSKVLMYSGGLDSFIISRMFKFDTIVFAHMGNEDNERELSLMYKVCGDESVKVVELPIAAFELPNKIIPYRNHMLAMLGAQYGSEIYFGFTGGDTTKDKDFVFKSQMEGILNYFALDQHKVRHQHYPYSIQMPYKEHSKGQMVAEYMAAGNRVADLWQLSRSCYAGNERECGQCRSCLRKFVALTVNGIADAETVFEHWPTHAEVASFYDECAAKGRFQTELDEIYAALEKRSPYSANVITVAEYESR